MSSKYYYRAFGLDIESDYYIPQVSVIEETAAPDLRIIRRDMGGLSNNLNHFEKAKNEMELHIQDVGVFCMVNGNLIEAEQFPQCTDNYFAVFLMGSAMGAILHERGILPIHGSCVTNGKQSIIITGDSGAGKSTTAVQFIKHGWRILTDDVSAIVSTRPVPIVQSSYPSQKLWQDSLCKYDGENIGVHSLYAHGDREKYGVDIKDRFYEGTAPLSMIVRLIPWDAPCQIAPVDAMAKVEQIRRNTYRAYMIDAYDRNGWFQKCMDIGMKVPMALMLRQNGVECAEEVYQMITGYLEKNQQ